MPSVTPMITSTQHTEALVVSTLIQLVIMIGAARIMNLVFRRFGQPGVIGETVAGLLLGPSLFGHFFPAISTAIFGGKPSPAIVILSQIGLLLLMFQIGMNFEFEQLRGARARRGLLPIAAVSVLTPFALGVWLGHLSAPMFIGRISPDVYALFCGVALAITALPILGRILTEYGLINHELGVLAIAAAAINDIVGWLLLAGVSAVATATFTPAKSAAQVAGVLCFALICVLVLRPLARTLLRRLPVSNGEIRPTLMAVMLICVFAMGICTFTLGIFTIFGGFAAGLLVHHNRDFVEAWRRQVGTLVMVFLLPIFFTFTGLRTNLLGLTTGTDWLWLLAFLAAATLGKIVPIFVVGRLLVDKI
jgi:Kef-type K+ transport system membrane component KefB